MKGVIMNNKITSLICAVVMLLVSGCYEQNGPGDSSTQTESSADSVDNVSEAEIIDSLNNGIIIDEVSGNVYKDERNANPISPNIFCADPTAVEYNGRLYVYGSNDTQQAENDTVNDYDYIKSLVVLSTDDMVNWIYHGRIEVDETAPWISNSWAPSIVSRVEEDGLTHFYLYFSNGGGGVIHTNVPKIVRLGADMLSFDSEFVSIDAPYFNEASELNYIDGTYYYTYCNDWQNRSNWDRKDIPAPPTCSMAYMTTKTPLDADSWEYRGAYFYNAGQNADGESGMRWANNHTHFCEYQGTNYIVHHTLLLEELSGGTAGFRSIMVDYLPMNAADGEIPITAATRHGVSQIKLLDPYAKNSGAVMFTSADIGYTDGNDPAAKSKADGAWIYVKGADFGYGASAFTADVKGKGRIEVRLDSISGKAVSFIEFDNADYAKVRSAKFSQFDGRNHNIYLVFSGADIELRSWQFTKGSEKLRPEEKISDTKIKYKNLVLTAQAVNPGPSPSAVVEMSGDGEYSVKSTSFEKGSELLNFGFINVDPDAKYKVHVKSIGLETENGIVEVPVNADLDPSSESANGLANGWMGAKIGSVVYGTKKCGIVAAKTTVDWIGYRFALVINGKEVPFTSITYNLEISNLILD